MIAVVDISHMKSHLEPCPSQQLPAFQPPNFSFTITIAQPQPSLLVRKISYPPDSANLQSSNKHLPSLHPVYSAGNVMSSTTTVRARNSYIPVRTPIPVEMYLSANLKERNTARRYMSCPQCPKT